MKETLANKIDAMQKRMLTNAAGARKRAFDASASRRAQASNVERGATASADAAEPATDTPAKR